MINKLFLGVYQSIIYPLLQIFGSHCTKAQIYIVHKVKCFRVFTEGCSLATYTNGMQHCRYLQHSHVVYGSHI